MATKKSIEIRSLAVKYLPRSIREVVGQPNAVQQLRSMIDDRQFSSAILLSGDSGCGKTTIARLIARYVNCEELTSKGEPCGECTSCRYEDDHPDFLEMNAADSRGIDDVRGLVAKAMSNPMIGDKRIILADECHMWTPQAAQLILKPLEEPPPNTLWILATTNPEKLPVAVRGRCKHLALQRVPAEAMTKRLETVCKKENFSTEFKGWDEVAKAICNFSSGQMRDALEMLDSVMRAVKSGNDDPKSIIKRFVSTPDAEAEEQAAHFLCAMFSGLSGTKALGAGIKGAVSAIKTTGTRPLIMKCRWLLQYLIDNATVGAKFTPYSARVFSKLAKDAAVAVKLVRCLQVQNLLLEIELRLNSVSIDEVVIGQSMVAEFMVENVAARD